MLLFEENNKFSDINIFGIYDQVYGTHGINLLEQISSGCDLPWSVSDLYSIHMDVVQMHPSQLPPTCQLQRSLIHIFSYYFCLSWK